MAHNVVASTEGNRSTGTVISVLSTTIVIHLICFINQSRANAVETTVIYVYHTSTQCKSAELWQTCPLQAICMLEHSACQSTDSDVTNSRKTCRKIKS